MKKPAYILFCVFLWLNGYAQKKVSADLLKQYDWGCISLSLNDTMLFNRNTILLTQYMYKGNESDTVLTDSAGNILPAPNEDLSKIIDHTFNPDTSWTISFSNEGKGNVVEIFNISSTKATRHKRSDSLDQGRSFINGVPSSKTKDSLGLGYYQIQKTESQNDRTIRILEQYKNDPLTWALDEKAQVLKIISQHGKVWWFSIKKNRYGEITLTKK